MMLLLLVFLVAQVVADTPTCTTSIGEGLCARTSGSVSGPCTGQFVEDPECVTVPDPPGSTLGPWECCVGCSYEGQQGSCTETCPDGTFRGGVVLGTQLCPSIFHRCCIPNDANPPTPIPTPNPTPNPNPEATPNPTPVPTPYPTPNPTPYPTPTEPTTPTTQDPELTKCSTNQGNGFCLEGAVTCSGVTVASAQCPGQGNACCIGCSVQAKAGFCQLPLITPCPGKLVFGRCPAKLDGCCVDDDGTGGGGGGGDVIRECTNPLGKGFCVGGNDEPNEDTCTGALVADDECTGRDSSCCTGCSKNGKPGVCSSPLSNTCQGEGAEWHAEVCPFGSQLSCCIREETKSEELRPCSNAFGAGICIAENSNLPCSGFLVDSSQCNGLNPGGPEHKCCVGCRAEGRTGTCMDPRATSCKPEDWKPQLNAPPAFCPRETDRCCLNDGDGQDTESPTGNVEVCKANGSPGYCTTLSQADDCENAGGVLEVVDTCTESNSLCCTSAPGSFPWGVVAGTSLGASAVIGMGTYMATRRGGNQAKVGFTSQGSSRVKSYVEGADYNRRSTPINAHYSPRSNGV